MHPKRITGIILILSLIFLNTLLLSAQESTDEPEATEAPEVTETVAPETTETPDAENTTEVTGTEYTVRAGDTLFRIAVNNGVTVSELAAANGITNPSLIYTGQVLIIPSDVVEEPAATPTPETPEATEAPETTPEPGDDEDTDDEPVAGETYTVVAGDSLFRIAVRFNTTVADLIALNNITNRNLIFSGQQLVLPYRLLAARPMAQLMPTQEKAAKQVMKAPMKQPMRLLLRPLMKQQRKPPPNPSAMHHQIPIDGLEFSSGIEVFIANQDINALVSQVTQLGMGWVKITVNWAEIEAEEDAADFAVLDEAVDAFSEAGISVLLTLTGAPDWARPSATEFVLSLDGEYGPPDDVTLFGEFAGEVATRYAGKVQAYEIWTEPNLRRSWTSPEATTANERRLADTDYIELLTAANQAIEFADADAVVITAGLAPTGLNDGLNAIDDRIFLSELLAQGVTDVSDAIGVQPDGFGNPPEARFPTQSEGVESHFDNRHFFFLDTIADYRATLVNADAGDTPLWVTRAGWGTAEGNSIVAPISPFQDFLTYTSPDEQANIYRCCLCNC